MHIHIDYNSSEPIYKQVIDQIKLKIVCGEWGAGEKMPSIRELARELKINPTTAAKIYTELEHAGILTLRQGQGAFIADRPTTVTPEEICRQISVHARQMIIEALRYKLGKSEILGIVSEEYGKIVKGQP